MEEQFFRRMEQEKEQDNEEEDLAASIQAEGGFELKDRTYYFRNYKNCFVASEAVDWLVKKKKYSRERAVEVGEELRKSGVFEHVVEVTKPFKDDYLFFRFSTKPKVVIIGGGFAGSKLAKKLQGHYSVILIDKKSHFISLPSLPACVCDPTHIDSISAEHSKYLKNCKLINDTVVEVDSTTVHLAGGKKVKFDYLVVCTGSRYNVTLKGNDKVKIINAINPNDIASTYEDLVNARDIVVIGGGPVGVEVAGEIAHYFPEKNLSIVHGPEKFLERTAPKANKNIKRFFNSCKNVKCVLGEKVVSVEDDGYLTTDKGTRIKADIVYVCVGFIPNTEFLSKNFGNCLARNGAVNVDPLFCMKDSIFAIGDIVAIAEEKLAQNAEKHAEQLASNLLATLQGKTPQPYNTATRVMIVSLGPKKAIIIRGPDVYLEGMLASKMKQLVEFKIMRGL